MNKDFKAFNHDTGQIDLSKFGNAIQMKPIEIHLKEDGSIENKPSFAIVMADPNIGYVFGQISLKMLNEGLADIGYELVRTYHLAE
jgi:hypothetical protein